MILGTQDTWSTIHLPKQTSKPAYYILDPRPSVVDVKSAVKILLIFMAFLENMNFTTYLDTDNVKFDYFLSTIQFATERN